MNEDNLVKYYNKFNEDKRFNSRGGQVEYITTMKYVKEYLKEFDNPKILDIGAGTGAYCIPLSEDGYDVTALELVKHNLRYIESKSDKVCAYQGNAIDLSRFSDNTFDLVLLFGPMYHLISDSDKIKALSEAKRVTRENGIIMVAYIMNEYAILTHGFKENKIIDSINDAEVKKNLYVCPKCGKHSKISARRRIAGLADPGTFRKFRNEIPFSINLFDFSKIAFLISYSL